MRTTIGAAGRVTPSAHVRSRKFADDLVMVDLQNGEYFALDQVGARMWELLVSGMTPAEVAEVLSREYDANDHDILRDCTNLVGDLLERGLLEIASP